MRFKLNFLHVHSPSLGQVPVCYDDEDYSCILLKCSGHQDEIHSQWWIQGGLCFAASEGTFL